MLDPNRPALILAPMEGITDAPMRELQGETGAFDFAVSEFIRVAGTPVPEKVFRREIPELANDGKTKSGMPVLVQILGGDPDRMALSAVAACNCGAEGIDINFGCPAPTVNRHDGGASLLRYPRRIREIVATVRAAVPANVTVSAKLRLGWDCIGDVHENAAMAAEGGAQWITIHGRTRVQGYQPPVFWEPIAQVRESLGVPVVANGDIWTLLDYKTCRDITGCRHFMIGRGALANPALPYQIAHDLGRFERPIRELDWYDLFYRLVELMGGFEERGHGPRLMRLKQWMKLAHSRGTFPQFHELKQTRSLAEFFEQLLRSNILGADGPGFLLASAGSKSGLL